MLPENIVKILEKYKNNNQESIKSISKDINDIISHLNKVNDNLSEQIRTLLSNKNIDSAKEILKDCEILCDFIKSEEPLKITYPSHQINMEIAKEIAPDFEVFDEYTHIHICCEDICTKCKVKLTPTTIYYQRIINGDINRESILGFRCSQQECGSLYMIDSDMKNFDYSNTNIIVHTQRYHKINIKDEVYVVTDINKCSTNDHHPKDIIGVIPIIDTEGNVRFTHVNIIHCKVCQKYIMLKDTYQKIKDYLACQIIDETKEATNKISNSASNYDSVGSKLSQLGYNVNCVDKLTEKQRETLLSSIILSGILSQGEIVGNIDKNINNGKSRIGSKKDWSNAVAKWEHDKEFVTSFDIERSNDDINIEKIILKFTK